MGSGIPLLNEYKRDFFAKRFPQTIFGGPKLKLGYDAPVYVYINQIILFLMPFLFGGIFTLFVELNIFDDYIGVVVYGCLMCAFVIVTQIVTTVVQNKAPTDIPYPKKKNLLAEEDEVDFFSCCGVETFEFVVPKKKFFVNIVIHSVVAGSLCGLTLWYLLPKTLNNIYSNNTGATVVIFIFGWFSLCVAQYPLTVAAPPEPATYRTLDTLELSPLMRPFYLLVCIIFDLLHRFENESVFLLANQTLHIVFACMTVLWTSGLLPPLDCLFLWLFEQVHVHLLGGSPMASEIRLLVILALSLGVYFTAFFVPSSLATVLVSALTGYILSIDLGGLGRHIYHFFKFRNRVADDQGTVVVSSGAKKLSLFWKWGIFEFIYHVGMLAVTGVLTGLLNYNSNSIGSDAWKILGYVIIGLCVVEKILRDSQNVYVIFGFWRNFWYPAGSERKFKTGKRRLKPLGVIRRVIINWVSPLVMLAYLSILVTSTDPASVSATATLSTYNSVWYIFGVVRIFRWVWQGTVHCLLDLSITHIILVTMETDSNVITYGVPILSLIIGLCRDRCFQFLNKLYFYFSLLITSWTDKKQRRGSTAGIIGVSVFLFPVVIGIIAAATALSAPLLPLFTLPIFFIAFPRPNKFWPEGVGASANVNPDTMFYKQFAPEFSQFLRTAFADGSLGEPNPGNHYLVRFQDRLAWVFILERGHGFCTVNIKGLELQETSCHTAEAARLDELFEEAFETRENQPCSSNINQYLLHSLTPVDSQFMKTYSDARNVLTGVIDNPEGFPLAMSSFVKSLVWVILHHVNKTKLKNKKKENNDLSTNGATNNSQGNEKVELEDMPKNQETNNNVSNRNMVSSIPAPIQAGNMFVTADKTPRPSSSKAKKMKASWGSLASFTDSIFSEDEFTDNKKKTHKWEAKKEPSPLIGAYGGNTTKRKNSFDDDINDLMNDFEFGLPATDITKPKPIAQPVSMSKVPVKKQTFGNSIYKPVTNLAGSPDFKCAHSAQISLPPRWRELPLEYSQLSRFLGQFPKDWYKYVLETLDWSGTGQSKDSVVRDVAADDTLMNCYSQLIMACYSIFDANVTYGSASYLYKFYIGDLPWNAMLDWLSEDKELYNLVIKSYRYGFKLMLDQMLLGEASTPDMLQEYLEEYDRDWYIGLEKDEEWKTAVLSSKPQLFSLGHNNTQGTYSSRTLSLQEVKVYVGRLNAEAVKGQWSNLSLELLYFTNDDEERYSIQAHPTLLRNLTVQAADPPLGYPIFSSQPIGIPTI